MLCELPKAEQSSPRVRILPILLVNLSLILALTAWTPVAEAQDSTSEKTQGEISGTVLLEAGNRTADQVAVSLKSRVAGVFRSVLTDFGGHFEVRGLPAGRYEIVVEEAGYEAARTSVDLGGPSAKVVLHLKSYKASPNYGSKDMVSVRELRIPDKARNEYRKGLECVGKKDPAGSLSHFTKATRAYPNYYEAYYHIGATETKLGHMGEAMQAFQTAIDLSGGKYAWAEFGFGYVLYLQGRADEAETIIRRGLEVDDNSPDGYAILGMTLLWLNRVDEAEKSAREALLRKPDFAGAYLVLADVYARRRDYRMQLQNLDTYLQLDPTGPASERVHQARELTLKMLGESKPQD
jgi:tetratricopeptide (TPR) repeat protein